MVLYLSRPSWEKALLQEAFLLCRNMIVFDFSDYERPQAGRIVKGNEHNQDTKKTVYA